MCMTPEQQRKKNEALRDAEMQLYSTADGRAAKDNHMSHMAHMPMPGNSYERNMERGQ